MAIVARGLGQPDGPLVTGGYGTSELAPEGAIAAHLYGTGALTATLTNGATPEPEPSGQGWGWTAHHIALLKAQQADHARRPVAGAMSAHLAGTCRVFAEATTTEHKPTGFDDLALLLTLELV